MDFDRELVRGSLDLMILAVLNEEPLYGYLVQKRVREASGNRVRLQAGTLYPILYRLEEAGAVSTKWEQTTGRDRKWYRLTAKGRKMLSEQATRWNDYVTCVRGLLQPILSAAGGAGAAVTPAS